MHRDRGPGRPHDPHLGRAPMAEDQRIIHDHIDHDRADGHPQDDLRPFQRRKVGFQHHHQQGGKDAPARHGQIAAGLACDLLGLAQHQQDRLGPDHQGHRQRAEQDRQPHGHARHTPHLLALPARFRLGHHRHHGPGEARSEQEQHEEHHPRQHLRRQRRHIVPPQHQRIRQRDRELRHMAQDQRQPQHANRAHVLRGGQGNRGHVTHAQGRSAAR